MDVSVIVPIYGVEKYIDRALRSLFSQTKSDGVEFILVNDCTEDSSIEIAREVIKDFPHCIVRLVEHETNSGVAAARQTGLDAAIGEYVIHFDPDDWVEPEMLKELYDKAKEDDADVVICDYYMNDDIQQSYIKQSVNQNNPIDNINNLLCQKLHGSLWSKLVRRDVFNLNKIAFHLNINLMEDLFISCKIFCSVSRVSYLPKAYLHYMQHATSITHLINKKIVSEMVLFCFEIGKYLEGQSIYNDVKLALYHRQINIVQTCLKHLDREKQLYIINLFSDLKPYIMRTTSLRLSWRVALWLAYSGNLWVFNLLKVTVAFIKKIW